eukprot:8499222-Pyramimonas_sp.AAC.1
MRSRSSVNALDPCNDGPGFVHHVLRQRHALEVGLQPQPPDVALLEQAALGVLDLPHGAHQLRQQYCAAHP